jgi:hypothetical protein
LRGRGAAGWFADILFRSHVDGITVPWCRRPYVGFGRRSYSSRDEKLVVTRAPFGGENLLLTFVMKNGMNIPDKEFYGLFVPFSIWLPWE